MKYTIIYKTTFFKDDTINSDIMEDTVEAENEKQAIEYWKNAPYREYADEIISVKTGGVIGEIVEWFKDHPEDFIDCMEELDAYDGYLGDDRYYEMSMLDEFYCGTKPLISSLAVMTKTPLGRTTGANGIMESLTRTATTSATMATAIWCPQTIRTIQTS